MRRAINHTLVSGSAMACVIAALVLLDERVRTALADLVTNTRSSEVVHAGSTVHELGGVLFTALHDQSVANAPLMLFVVVATVLMLFMVRT